eukprot:847863-Rhodomonas_salina.1
MPPATVYVLDSIAEHVASETDAKRMVAETILDLGLEAPFDIHDDLNIDLEDPLPRQRLASNANRPGCWDRKTEKCKQSDDANHEHVREQALQEWNIACKQGGSIE